MQILKKNERSKPLLWNITTILVSSLNFASINFLTVTWKLNFLVYALLTLAISCICSILAVEMERSVKYGVLSFVFGLVIALGLLSAPPVVYGRSIAEANEVAALSLGILGKFLLVGVVVCIFGIIVGWFFNEISGS